ncbi:solute carrier family 15 member 4-like [Corticium candelabrum]|uniref:solute carrier family 15 member 4-like n=1 Tax=Corticium candelabrum TaxID=121492 RepID=UPI002E304159|nr:solute carrier family 15 member 4-like [Corticium candelabrum]
METVYSQIRNAFVDQAIHMDLGFDSQQNRFDKNNTIMSDYCDNTTTRHTVIPTAVMYTICSGTVLVMIPVTWCIVPRLHAKWKRRLPTMLERILIGMVLGIVTCLLAIVTETIRLKTGHIHHICGNHKLEDSHIPLIIYSSTSVFIQTPQHITLGLSSALIITGVSEFVLSRAPSKFRCTAYGCTFFVEGVGYYISIILLLIMKKSDCYYQTYCTSAAINIKVLLKQESESKTWVFYTVLTVLMIAGTLAFGWVKYRHRDVLRKERNRIPTRVQLSS